MGEDLFSRMGVKPVTLCRVWIKVCGGGGGGGGGGSSEQCSWRACFDVSNAVEEGGEGGEVSFRIEKMLSGLIAPTTVIIDASH